jgi:exodeoxyribonuclease-5
MAVELSKIQKYYLYRLWKGVEAGEKEQTLGGYAGTGKTTIIKYLAKMLPEFGVSAYTGKAANVLRKKGVEATTIHSRIYKPVFEKGEVEFDLVPSLDVNGLIIDEASMVPRDIYEDLKYFGIPLIFVGDHGQLEPIGTDFNLMGNPMYKLEEIHRNAGDIARFAQHLRLGFASRSFQPQDGSVQMIHQENVQHLIQMDQIICAYNSTRVAMNNSVRQAMGYKGLLNIGERVMCLRNNREAKLFNGMQGVVKALYETKRKAKRMDFDFDGTPYENIRYDPKQFGQSNYKFKGRPGKGAVNPFDYAYCITCHKAQGDEWGKMMVLEQKNSKWDHRRWSYTAASRARDLLVWKVGY